MKHFLIGFCLVLCTTGRSQVVSADYQVTLNGIGPFKIDMNKPEIEKKINQSIATPKSSRKDNYENDTVHVRYKDAELTLVFYKRYINEDSSAISLYSVSGKSALLKTRSGIGLGDDKIKIVSTYNDFNMNIFADYEPNEKGEYKRSKTKSTITLMDEESNSVIDFLLESNKVIGFRVTLYEGC